VEESAVRSRPLTVTVTSNDAVYALHPAAGRFSHSASSTCEEQHEPERLPEPSGACRAPTSRAAWHSGTGARAALARLCRKTSLAGPVRCDGPAATAAAVGGSPQAVSPHPLQILTNHPSRPALRRLWRLGTRRSWCRPTLGWPSPAFSLCRCVLVAALYRYRALTAPPPQPAVAAPRPPSRPRPRGVFALLLNGEEAEVDAAVQLMARFTDSRPPVENSEEVPAWLSWWRYQGL